MTSCWPHASKEMIATRNINVKSPSYSEMQSPVKDRFGQMPADGVVHNQFLKDTDKAGWSGGHCHFGIIHGNGGASDMIDCKEMTPKWLRYDKHNVYIITHDRERIKLSVNLWSTVFELRKKIYGVLNIPLNKWRLQSFGGKLLWDRHTLTDYDIKDGGTLSMRLLMKGGGSESERHQQEPSSPGTQGIAIATVHPKYPEEKIVKRVRHSGC